MRRSLRCISSCSSSSPILLRPVIEQKIFAGLRAAGSCAPAARAQPSISFPQGGFRQPLAAVEHLAAAKFHEPSPGLDGAIGLFMDPTKHERHPDAGESKTMPTL